MNVLICNAFQQVFAPSMWLMGLNMASKGSGLGWSNRVQISFAPILCQVGSCLTAYCCKCAFFEDVRSEMPTFAVSCVVFFRCQSKVFVVSFKEEKDLKV